MKVISIANQKGGVAKTTTAMNLAAGLVRKGKTVLCIDFDPQSNLSDYLGYKAQDNLPTISELMVATATMQRIDVGLAIRHNDEGIDYIPASIMLSSADVFLSQVMCREQILKRILSVPEIQSYDYVLVDCLPSLGILLTNALTASDAVLIPVQAQKFSLDGLSQLAQVIDMVKTQINPQLAICGVLLTMADNTNMSRAVEEALHGMFGDKVFSTKIRRSIEAANSTYEHRSLVSRPKSKLGSEYMAVVEELLERGV